MYAIDSDCERTLSAHTFFYAAILKGAYLTVAGQTRLSNQALQSQMQATQNPKCHQLGQGEAAGNAHSSGRNCRRLLG